MKHLPESMFAKLLHPSGKSGNSTANRNPPLSFETTSLMTSPYRLEMPETQRAPFLFNSPHSGRCYTDDFKQSSHLSPHELRYSEDAYIDLLFADIPAHGLPLMAAHFPRAFLDLNREPYELDATMFNGPLPPFVKTSSPRVGSGLGTIARIVSERREIYHSKLTPEEGLERIELYYKPYHQTLRRQIALTHVNFGYACLIDCHSMPSRVLRNTSPATRPDIILGNRYGSSCHSSITDAARDCLTDLGFKVELNKPYAGGFITQHYGKPLKGLHALQVEIDRSLYMDEESLEPLDRFGEIADLMGRFSLSLQNAISDVLLPQAQAAE